MSTNTEPLTPVGPRRPRWQWLLAIATAIVVVAAIVVAVLLRSDGSQQGAAPAAPGTSPGTSTAAPHPTTPPTSGPGTSQVKPVPGFAYQPLWPFASIADAAAWQQSYRTGGHSPWHRDAGMTAQSFTQGYLGYANVNLITSQTVTAAEAWIGVGYALPNGQHATAAVIHLTKISTGVDAPWEVVGTRDTTLTLTQPKYGGTVNSPITAGGRITGVDESLRVQVMQLDQGLVGQTGSVPAGGQNAPWSAQVPFKAPTGSMLTIAVSTGGHVTDVERFAVTGARAGRSASAVDGDVDGDGRADMISFPAHGQLRVDYGPGRSDTVPFAVPDPVYNTVILLGVTDADQDGHAEVFVRTDTGAATEFATVFRYVAGHLRMVTLDGQQTELGYGGSVTVQQSWACRPPTKPIITWTGLSTDGESYHGTILTYRFDGTRLVQIGSAPLTVTPASPGPTGCGPIRLR